MNFITTLWSINFYCCWMSIALFRNKSQKLGQHFFFFNLYKICLKKWHILNFCFSFTCSIFHLKNSAITITKDWISLLHKKTICICNSFIESYLNGFGMPYQDFTFFLKKKGISCIEQKFLVLFYLKVWI